jgi:hypothetical protein
VVSDQSGERLVTIRYTEGHISEGKGRTGISWKEEKGCQEIREVGESNMRGLNGRKIRDGGR